ncbi:hypothetical protein L596_013815 [Steinernema carpocapsae]|uniref:TIL domain-containing protein n=1 Tax=Steinernema carpocapsae TaxID=34508 RepID=A0A4U5P1F5_STECR|nr:hypothetical protein L596_013815 [Steinernema carpocapsae]
MQFLVFLIYLGTYLQISLAEVNVKTFPLPKNCPPHSHAEKCGNCEPFCDPEPRVCTLNCYPGCVCDSGYIRSINGTCITIKQCENTCNCPKGTTCVHAPTPRVCIRAPCFQFDCVKPGNCS